MVDVPASDAQEKSFNASLEIVKLFTTLSSGGLAFSIGLMAQSTNNYPEGFRGKIIGSWFVFFVAILAGIFAQMQAPRLINSKRADPNAGVFRWPTLLSVLLFIVGIVFLGYVLVSTARFGAPGRALAVSSPTAAIAKALDAAGVKTASKVAALEFVKGVDPVRPDQSVWHVQLETSGTADKTVTLDVYVDPVSGCAYVLQRVPHTAGARCAGF